jgi:hypothetical protein
MHIGKVSGSDFELSYNLMRQFLMSHSIRNGCTLTTVNDSIDDVEYRPGYGRTGVQAIFIIK